MHYLFILQSILTLDAWLSILSIDLLWSWKLQDLSISCLIIGVFHAVDFKYKLSRQLAKYLSIGAFYQTVWILIPNAFCFNSPSIAQLSGKTINWACFTIIWIWKLNFKNYIRTLHFLMNIGLAYKIMMLRLRLGKMIGR